MVLPSSVKDTRMQSFFDAGIMLPTPMVIPQFNRRSPMKINPFISELNMDDNTKKQINIKGARINPAAATPSNLIPAIIVLR